MAIFWCDNFNINYIINIAFVKLVVDNLFRIMSKKVDNMSKSYYERNKYKVCYRTLNIYAFSAMERVRKLTIPMYMDIIIPSILLRPVRKTCVIFCAFNQPY